MENKKEEIEDKPIDEEEIEDNPNLKETIEALKPLIETLAPHILEHQKINAPIIKRQQIINFLIMFGVLVSITGLAYFKIIDGSAATGLIGAIIGYVFGGLYQNRQK